MKIAAQRKADPVRSPTRFLSVADFTPSQLEACLELASELKRARAAGVPHIRPLEGRHIALLFDKPSLRTRATFQIAVRELGGDVIEPPQDVALGGREAIKDVARNLERWVHGAVVRTFAQARLEAFAAAAPRLRIVNALTDQEHTSATATTSHSRWRRPRRRSGAKSASRRRVDTSSMSRRAG